MSNYMLDGSSVQKLQAFRSGNMRLLDFQTWAANSVDLTNSQIPSGILLKLKRGDVPKVMAAIVSLIPACKACSQLPKPKEFTNRAEHADCALRVDACIAVGVLQRIKCPDWVSLQESHVGAYACYMCATCESMWLLVEPERQDNGLWERLA